MHRRKKKKTLNIGRSATIIISLQILICSIAGDEPHLHIHPLKYLQRLVHDNISFNLHNSGLARDRDW
jgi:hypothetical protein